MATYLWTADTVMYDGVSMDRAYSGSTLIWCKSCPRVIVGLEQVFNYTGIVKGQDYVIGNAGSGGWWFDGSGGCSGSLSNAVIFTADNDYPPVYHDECTGYVTDTGWAFGLRMSSPAPSMLDYGYTFGEKTRFGSYIDDNSSNIKYGRYDMVNYYSWSPTAGGTKNQTGFQFEGSAKPKLYTVMKLYRVIYGYQS